MSFWILPFSHSLSEVISPWRLTTLHRGSDHRSDSGMPESCRPTTCALIALPLMAETTLAICPYDATRPRGMRLTTVMIMSLMVMSL